jgi:large subunit ribosomal protein L30
MGAVIKMVLESAIHLSREAGICRGQPGRAGERLTRSQCAAGALDWGRKKKPYGPTAEACFAALLRQEIQQVGQICPTSATAFMSVETFKIVQTGSPIRRHHKQRETLIGLGLNRIGRVAEVANTRATWGMIAKVRHLIRVIDENLFEEHQRPDRHVADEDADKLLVRNLIFEPRRIRAEAIPEDQSKTPDFKLLKDGALRAYCEIKSPTDSDLFDFADDLAPGEIRVEVRKDPAVFSLARLIAKAAKQFKAANPHRAHPNILVIVNHARRKGPADLRMALDGIRSPEGRRFFPLVNDEDKWEVQKGVWEAARSIDLFVWVDPRKRIWQAFRPSGAQRLAEACDLLGIAPLSDEANGRVKTMEAIANTKVAAETGRVNAETAKTEPVKPKAKPTRHS